MKILKYAVPLTLLLVSPLATAADDVSYLEAANYLAGEDIIVDQSKNPEKYNLKGNILRQEIAGTIAKMANIPAKDGCDNLFADVKITADNSWACPRIESLLDAGIIAKNRNYNPTSYVTKSEALGFILGALYKNEYDVFKDKKVSWQDNAVNFASGKGILTENIGDYNSYASRGFIFKIMYNAKNETPIDLELLRELLGEEIFNDLEIYK